MMNAILERAAKIRLLIFDVDGVLTDGSLFVGDDGQEYKSFYSRDGLGMTMLQNTGVIIGIITGRTSQVVKHRMQLLGVKYVFQGRTNKLPAFHELCHTLNLTPEQVAFVGDDVIDVPVLNKVGLAVAVGDAHDSILPYTHWQTKAMGGRGAAREVCELIMQAQGTLAKELKRFEVEFEPTFSFPKHLNH